MTAGTPARTCERCEEYLPHWCAPVITIRYEGGRRRRHATVIEDRQAWTAATPAR